MPPLPSYDEALARVLAAVPAVGEERTPLERALGRVLRREVRADRDQPPFDRSAMDGFAVRSGDVRSDSAHRVDGEVPAGAADAAFLTPLPGGAARRIATGAPLPAGADAVVPVEQAIVEGQRGRAETVRFLLDAARPWQHVHRRGSDAGRGTPVLAAGTRLAPQHIGIAAAVGVAELAVAARPRVTLLTTGDEVVPAATPTESLGPQQIRNSNAPMLAALLAAMGAPPLRHEHLPDEPQRTLAAARDALAQSHLVVTNGGVSVGERDFLPWAWRELALETRVHGVAIQPGKPVLAAADAGKLVLGLPGNPVSVLCTAHLFVWPVLRAMTGETPAALPWRDVLLAEPVKASSKREVFRAAKLNADGTAVVISWQGSGDLMHTAAADGFVRLPLSDEPTPPGCRVPFLPLAGGIAR